MFDPKNKDIDAIKNAILQTVPCERIYLFGSYAYGTPTDESDYDFYVIIPDEGIRPLDATSEIYSALPTRKPYKSVDILVRRASDFEGRKGLPTIEKEIFNRGVVLYES